MTEKTTAPAYCLQVANQVSAILAYWDKDEICKFANSAIEIWLGKPSAEVVGLHLSKLLGPELYKKNRPHIIEVLQGKAQTFERVINTPSGETRHALINYFPDFLNGAVNGFFVHVADVTTIKNLEVDLKASELKFKELLETAPDAIVIVNKTGKIQLINAQCESMFGYTKQELVDQPIETLLPERLRANHQKQRIAYSKLPKPRPMGDGSELFGLRKNGEEFPVEISLSPLKLGTELLISAAIRDVTWKIEKQNELIHSMDIINKQNKRLLNFAHVVSHNLRTHSINLASIINLLDAAKTEEEKNQIMDFLRNVSSGFSETISNLNVIVDLQTEKKLELAQLNLSQYIQRCLDTLDVNIKLCGAIIKNNIDPNIEIEHNPSYLESIIQNFLTNAIKYRDPKRTLVIKLNSYIKKNEVILRIEDNGQGMNLKKNGHKLFGMYQTFHRNADAKGIGLFITKYQVEELGGHIDVMSKEGVGTVFTIYFINKEKQATA